MTVFFTAKQDTWLKKDPDIPAANQPTTRRVGKGEAWMAERLLDSRSGHYQVRLSWGAGEWWLYREHWAMADEDTVGAVPTASFTMPLRPNRNLIVGEFRLSLPEDNKILVYPATSGQPGWQTRENFKTRGKGPIPPGKYSINSRGYVLSNPGIAGYYFHITPDPIPGYGRSEIGLHDDANRTRSPGTAGCIGLTDTAKMKELTSRLLALKGKPVPLEVIYTPMG